MQVFKDVPDKGLTVFETGNKEDANLTFVTEPINDYWYLSFAPADTRPQLTLAPIITPWVMALGGTLLCLFLLIWLQNRAIKHNQVLLLNFVRNLYRKHEFEWPTFTIELFYDLAKSMQHLAQSKGVQFDTETSSASKPRREKRTLS